MALNRNDAFNPNDTTWMDSGVDPSERGFISKSLRFIFGSAKGIVKGTAEGLLDNLVDEHLDKLSDAKDVFDSFTEAAGKATKELSDDLKEFKSAAREIGLKYTEGMAGAMPSGLYRRLSRAFEEPEDEDSYSPGDQLEASISSNLASIFSAQARHTAGLHHISMQSAATDRALAAKYHKQDMIVSTIGSRSAANIDTFLHSTYVNYLKKDLELKYRNLHLMRTLSSNIESLKGEFSEDGVVGRLLKNTNPLGQTVGEHERVTTGTYQRNFFSETLDNLLMTPSFVLQSLSGIMSAHASVPFEGVSDVVASITKHTAPWLLKKIGPKLISEARQKKLKKTWEKAQLGLGLLNGDFGAISKMAPMKMNALAKTLQNSDNWFMSMIGNMMPTFERTTSIANLAATNPKDPATFDNLTRETIVTIIPEHLSRIGDYIEALSKQQGIRIERGDSKVWDVRSRSFVTRADQRKRNLETIYGSESERKERYQSNVDAFVALTGAGDIDMHNTALKNQFVGKPADVKTKQQELVQRYQADLAQFIENSAYHLRELDIRALIACARNDEDGIQEEYLNQVFGTIDAKARNIASVIVNLVTNYDSKGRVRGINRVFMDHINKRIMDRAKEHNEYDDIRQQLRDQNQYDHEDYYFNMYGSGYLRENAFLDRFRRDHAINGDVNVFQRVVDMARDEDVMEKLNERSANAYKFARSRSKNARERLLHDQLLMNTGLASTSMIPGFLLRWINSAYGFTAEKFGETSDAISKAIENNELLNTVKSDIFSKHKNVIVGLRALRKDPKNPGNIIFRIQIKKKGEGSANNDDKLYSYKLTYEEWKNFTHVPDKPSRELKSFIDTFIDTIGGKKEYDVDWKTFKLSSEWPDKEESSTYEFNDVIYGSSRKQGGFGTSGQSLVHRYLDSIDRNLVDIRNSVIPSLDKSGDGGKRLSVHDQQLRFARFAKQRLAAVARLIESKAKEVKEQPSLGLEISSLYDEGIVKGAANELKTIEDTKEYEEIFASAIQSFEEQAFHYYLCHIRTRPLDGDDIEALEEKYGINVQAKIPVPVFNYEDPVAKAIADKKSIKDPYAPMNNWLKSKGSALVVSSKETTVSTFKDGVEEIEHIVFSDAKIKAYKAMDELTGSTSTVKAYTPRQQWEVLAKRVRDPNFFKVKQAPIDVKDEYTKFDVIMSTYRAEALKHSAWVFYLTFSHKATTIPEDIVSRLMKRPGYLKEIKSFSQRVDDKLKQNEKFTNRMTSWIKQNSDAEETITVTPGNFEIGAIAIDNIIREQADRELYNKYIYPDTASNKETRAYRGDELGAIDTSKQEYKGYTVAGYARKQVTILRRLAKRLGLVKDSPVFKMTGKSFGLSGNTEAGNVIDSAAQKLGQDGWFANSETFNINPSSKGLSIIPEITAGNVITGKPSKLSSGYADGTYGRATLHAEGDESMIERFKKAKMFSALTGWIKALKSKKEDTNIVSEERKLEKAGFNPKDLIAPATLAVIADKLDIGNAISASAEGGGGTSIFGIPTDLLRKVGHGLWTGTKWTGKHMWHGLQWTAGKIPGLGRLAGNAAKGAVNFLPRLPGALLGAGMGFGGSRSSNASWTSTAISTAAGFGAGAMMYGNIWNPIGWTLAGIMAINAAREGWVDEHHLKVTWGAIHKATTAQKGASALGNILNYLSFGILKASGAQKHIDRAIYKSGVGQVAGGLGEAVAGAYQSINPSNTSEDEALSGEQLQRARAALQTDIKRGEKDAVARLNKFEKAVKVGDWRTARDIAGIHSQTVYEAEQEAKARAMTGLKQMFGMIKENPDDIPMSDNEKTVGKRALEYVAKKDSSYTELLHNYEELVASERWAYARNIVRDVLTERANMGDLKASMYLEDFNSFTSDTSKPKSAQEKISEIREEAELNRRRGRSKHNDQVLARLDKIVKDAESEQQFTNPYSQYSMTGEIQAYKDLDSVADLSEEQIKRARAELARRYKEDGNQAAGPMLLRLDNAIKYKRWNEVRAIISSAEIDVDDKATYHGGFFEWLGSKLGDKRKAPMSETEILNTRNKLQTQFEETGNPDIQAKLNEFNNAVKNNDWVSARRISGYTSTSWTKPDNAQLSDRKMTSSTKLAQRYRLIYERAVTAWKHLPLGDQISASNPLTILVKEMRKTDLAELTPQKLTAFEERLRMNDATSGLITDQDIAEHERERLEKQDLLMQQELLLKEIATSQQRIGDRDYKKTQELKQLFEEVKNLTQSELTKDLLRSYDKYLKSIDSEALSTVVYSLEMREKMNEARIRRHTLIGNIEDAISRTSDVSIINDLNSLKAEVKNADLENLVDGSSFDAWDKVLKQLSPSSISSVRRTEKELNKLADNSNHQAAMVRMIERRQNNYTLPKDVNDQLDAMKKEIANKAPDEVNDDMFKNWLDKFNQMFDTNVTKKEVTNEVSEHDTLVRKRTTLMHAFSSKLNEASVNSRFGSKKQEYKDLYNKYNPLYQKHFVKNKIPDSKLTENDVAVIEADLNNLVSEFDNLKNNATMSSGAVEQAVSLDRNGNIVDSQTGSATSVSLKTAPGGQIIHTHPDGSPTSATDIAAAIQNGQTAVTTLRSSGNVLGYSNQTTKRGVSGETVHVKRNEQNGNIELDKALTDMTKGIQNGFNSIDTNRDVLVGIYDRLGDVIDAVSEHNVNVNNRIDTTALKSYDLARKFTTRMMQKAKDVALVFNRPSVINISK